MAPGTATWEDLEPLRQAFLRAPAWGQAGFEDEGIVNSTNRQQAIVGKMGRATSEAEVNGPVGPNHLGPRTRRLPARLADPMWVRS